MSSLIGELQMQVLRSLEPTLVFLAYLDQHYLFGKSFCIQAWVFCGGVLFKVKVNYVVKS